MNVIGAGNIYPSINNPVPPIIEDAAGEDYGESVDTFSNYKPTALPNNLIRILNNIVGTCSSNSSKNEIQMDQEMSDAEVISIPSSCSLTTTTKEEILALRATEANLLLKDKGGETIGNIGANAAVKNKKNKTKKFAGEVIEILDDDSDTSCIDGLGDNNQQKNEKNRTTENNKGLATTAAHMFATTNKVLSKDMASHTTSVCESALLSSVQSPRASEESSICFVELARRKVLSPLQLEGACLAISRHNRFFRSRAGAMQPAGVRAGFFIGDGAGVGKGRQISAILRDSLCRSRPRHVWISVSRELIADARRDLTDVGVYCNVHDGSELLDRSNGRNSTKQKGLGLSAGLNKGVLFLTYALLVSSKRLEDTIQWLTGATSKSSRTDSGDRKSVV